MQVPYFISRMLEMHKTSGVNHGIHGVLYIFCNSFTADNYQMHMI